MCNDREGNLVNDKTTVTAKCKDHFQQLLNDENGNVAKNRMNIDYDDQAVDLLGHQSRRASCLRYFVYFSLSLQCCQ